MAQVAKALKKDLENTTVSNPVEAVVRRLYRLSQVKCLQPWNEDHAHTMIICATDESEARELARVCEEGRECGQLWDINNAEIKEISMTKGQVIQVA